MAREGFEHSVKRDVEARVREGVMAGYRELTLTRCGDRNVHYTRNLVTSAGRIERLEVPRDRDGEFVIGRLSIPYLPLSPRTSYPRLYLSRHTYLVRAVQYAIHSLDHRSLQPGLRFSRLAPNRRDKGSWGHYCVGRLREGMLINPEEERRHCPQIQIRKRLD